MNRVSSRMFAPAALLAFVFTIAFVRSEGGSKVRNPLNTPNATGTLSTYDENGGIDVSNPFFQNLGSNGRTCNSCHVSSEAWTVTPE